MPWTSFSNPKLPPYTLDIRLPAYIGVNIDDIGVEIGLIPPEGCGVAVLERGETNLLRITSYDRAWFDRAVSGLARVSSLASDTGPDTTSA